MIFPVTRTNNNNRDIYPYVFFLQHLSIQMFSLGRKLAIVYSNRKYPSVSPQLQMSVFSFCRP